MFALFLYGPLLIMSLTFLTILFYLFSIQDSGSYSTSLLATSRKLLWKGFAKFLEAQTCNKCSVMIIIVYLSCTEDHLGHTSHDTHWPIRTQNTHHMIHTDQSDHMTVAVIKGLNSTRPCPMCSKCFKCNFKKY